MSSKKEYKIWRTNKDSVSGMMVTPDSAAVIGSKTNFMLINQQGTHISGPLSLITTSDNIRQGGLFVQMPDFVRMIPSTIVTPIPSQVPFAPVAFVSSIARSMPFMLALAVV